MTFVRNSQGSQLVELEAILKKETIFNWHLKKKKREYIPSPLGSPCELTFTPEKAHNIKFQGAKFQDYATIGWDIGKNMILHLQLTVLQLQKPIFHQLAVSLY